MGERSTAVHSDGLWPVTLLAPSCEEQPDDPASPAFFGWQE